MALSVKISAVIITYNEERNIERCLSSLHGIADEILVVDSFSTDRTEEICEEFGIKFIQHPFNGHVEQKNYAMEQALYHHVLSLDADEALSTEMRNHIMQIKRNWTYDGYIFRRKTNFCGKWIRKGSWYPDKKLRLWDRRLGGWGGLNPHDKVMLKEGSVRTLSSEILHFSYYSVDEYLEQIRKFSTISAKSMAERGQHPSFRKLIFNPLWRFYKGYFVKGGFLLGKEGLIIEFGAAWETFLKYYKLFEMERAAQKRQ